MKRLDDGTVLDLLERLSRSHDLYLPLEGSGGERFIGLWGEGTPSLVGGIPSGNPILPFLPPTEEFLLVRGGDYLLTPSPCRPVALAGLFPPDRRALGFVDRFMTDGFTDDLYLRRRRDGVVIGIAGMVGEGGEWVAPTGTGCDLELVRFGGDWFAAPLSEAVDGLVREMPEVDPPVWQEVPVRQEERLVGEASRILREGEPPPSLWQEIGDRCIGCGGCTHVCPTCTCFTLRDWMWGDGGERSRLRDSCQLPGFARQAGGHDPLGTAAFRSRRRIRHKLVDDPVRRGEISCVACGRCDRHCPTGIGMLAVCRRITTGSWG